MTPYIDSQLLGCELIVIVLLEEDANKLRIEKEGISDE